MTTPLDRQPKDLSAQSVARYAQILNVLDGQLRSADEAVALDAQTMAYDLLGIVAEQGWRPVRSGGLWTVAPASLAAAPLQQVSPAARTAQDISQEYGGARRPWGPRKYDPLYGCAVPTHLKAKEWLYNPPVRWGLFAVDAAYNVRCVRDLAATRAVRPLFVQREEGGPWLDFGLVRARGRQNITEPILLAYCRAIEQAPARTVIAVLQLVRATAVAMAA